MLGGGRGTILVRSLIELVHEADGLFRVCSVVE